MADKQPHGNIVLVSTFSLKQYCAEVLLMDVLQKLNTRCKASSDELETKF